MNKSRHFFHSYFSGECSHQMIIDRLLLKGHNAFAHTKCFFLSDYCIYSAAFILFFPQLFIIRFR